MPDPALQGQIDAARAYEALFVDGLLEEWADQVLDAASIQPGHRVLDVACGTGILARHALARVGAAGSVVGLDIGPGMLAVAAELAPDIEWQQGPAESLPFADHSFDAVVSQFGLMFFQDRCQAIREMLRVLKPGGTLAVAVWNEVGTMPAYRAEVALLARTAGEAAANALKAPFVLGDRHSLQSLFELAGTTKVSITTKTGKARFPNIRTMVEADLRGWLPVMGVMLPEEQIRYILEEAESALRAFVVADRSIRFDTSAHILKGIRSN